MADATRVINAIYEQALFRLGGNEQREQLQAQGVKSVGIQGGFSESFGQQMYGITLAPRAKLLLTGCFAVGVMR